MHMVFKQCCEIQSRWYGKELENEFNTEPVSAEHVAPLQRNCEKQGPGRAEIFMGCCQLKVLTEVLET